MTRAQTHGGLDPRPAPCDSHILRQVPLFALLDDEETAVLAAQVESRPSRPRQRIYKMGDPARHAYVLVSGTVRVTTVDEDHQEVMVDEPAAGEFFGFASMLEQTPHQTDAIAVDETTLRGGRSPRYRRAAGAQAARRHGHADRARPSVSRLAATGARSGPCAIPTR